MTQTLSQLKIAPETIDIDLDIIALRNGNMEGSMRIQGNVVDPNFYGTIFLEDLRGTLALIPQPMRASSAVMILEEQSIQFPPFLVEAGEGRAVIQGGLVIDHWIPSELTLSIDTEEGNVPIIYDFNSVAVDGWASGMLELNIDFLTGGADIAGSIVANAAGVTISDSARRRQAAAQAQNNPVPVTVNIEIVAGRGVEFYWPTRDLPIFRSFAVSGESINFSYSNIEERYDLTGTVAISGGELFYFEQDFNIRQGDISFNGKMKPRNLIPSLISMENSKVSSEEIPSAYIWILRMTTFLNCSRFSALILYDRRKISLFYSAEK